MRRILVLAPVVWLALSGSSAANTISTWGFMEPQDPNDVVIYKFELAGPDIVTIQSWGYGGGTNAEGIVFPGVGFDAYLSLFAGTGEGATFVASDDDSGCPPGNVVVSCRDPQIAMQLAAGRYTLAITTFGNMSFAENLGTGTLGDGFIGLGSYFDQDTLMDRTSLYAVDLSAPNTTITEVPEPSLLTLTLWAWAGYAATRRRLRARPPGNHPN